MFVAIYQVFLKLGRENEYQEAWSKVAQYFIGSYLHRTSESPEQERIMNLV